MRKYFKDLSEDSKLIIFGIIAVIITFLFMLYGTREYKSCEIATELYVVEIQEPCDTALNTSHI